MTVAVPSTRRPALVGLLVLALLVLGFGFWSVTARLSGAVVAHGRIEADQTHLPVEHPDGGLVAAVHVGEGAKVAAGTILLELDGTALSAEREVIDLRLADLAARGARLLAERDGLAAPAFPPDLLALAARDAGIAALVAGQSGLFERRRAGLDEMRAQLDQRIAQIRAEVTGLSAQQSALSDQLHLLDQERSATESLADRGLVRQAQVLALGRERARLEGQIAGLHASAAAAEGRVTEIELQRAALLSRREEEAATELRAIEAEALELQTRRAALTARIARLALRAPVGGTVMGLAVAAPGAVLRPADPALTLVPGDRPLVVMAALAPIHIDEVAVGQSAELAFPALASRAAPRLRGRVAQISPDALSDPRTGALHYLLRVEIAPAELARLDSGTLVPGMPAEVFLTTRSRTALAYFLEPFTAYFSRALRES